MKKGMMKISLNYSGIDDFTWAGKNGDALVLAFVHLHRGPLDLDIT